MLFLGLQDHFWLAGTDVANQSNFYWLGHDKPLTFSDWHPGQPDHSDQGCLTIQYWPDNGLYQWDNDHCTTQFYFMCEERMSKVVCFYIQEPISCCLQCT